MISWIQNYKDLRHAVKWGVIPPMRVSTIDPIIGEYIVNPWGAASNPVATVAWFMFGNKGYEGKESTRY